MFSNGCTDKQNVVDTYNRILALKKNKILIHATTGMKLKDTMLNKGRQSQKTNRYDLT